MPETKLFSGALKAFLNARDACSQTSGSRVEDERRTAALVAAEDELNSFFVEFDEVAAPDPIETQANGKKK